MRRRTKAAVLTIATTAAIGMFATPANASVYRGHAGAINWMYTTQWGHRNFYYHNTAKTTRYFQIKVSNWPDFARKCVKAKAGEHGHFKVKAILAIYAVPKCPWWY